MPEQHLVPKIASAIHASARIQANALEALALAGISVPAPEWRDRAAAALLIGAEWAGDTTTPAAIAEAAGVTEQAVAKHYAILAERLKNIAPR